MKNAYLMAIATALFGAAGLADAAVVSNLIVNGGFGAAIGAPWTTSEGIAQRRTALNDIDRNLDPLVDERDSFDDFFDSAFLVLGDSAGVIGGDTESGTSTISQTFFLPTALDGKDILSFDLRLRFDFVFDGVTNIEGTGTALSTDRFTATLEQLDPANDDPLSALTMENRIRNTSHTEQLALLNIGAPINDASFFVPGGKYRLSFSLNEANGTRFNSAVGIDDVRLLGTATVVPIPAGVYLLSSSLAGMALISRRRQIGRAFLA